MLHRTERGPLRAIGIPGTTIDSRSGYYCRLISSAEKLPRGLRAQKKYEVWPGSTLCIPTPAESETPLRITCKREAKPAKAKQRTVLPRR